MLGVVLYTLTNCTKKIDSQRMVPFVKFLGRHAIMLAQN